MAADAHAPTASEYIVHHLQHLQNIKQNSIIDFSVVNLDSVAVSVVAPLTTVTVEPVGAVTVIVGGSPPVDEIVSSEMEIFAPAVRLFCFPSSAV